MDLIQSKNPVKVQKGIKVRKRCNHSTQTVQHEFTVLSLDAVRPSEGPAHPHPQGVPRRRAVRQALGAGSSTAGASACAA